jgi:hypothetical protein
MVFMLLGLVVLVVLVVFMVVDWRRFVDDRIEAVVLVGGIVNGAHRTVRFDQRVLTLDNIAVAGFVLGFHVAGVMVADAVFEGVLGWGLDQKKVSISNQRLWRI